MTKHEIDNNDESGVIDLSDLTQEYQEVVIDELQLRVRRTTLRSELRRQRRENRRDTGARVIDAYPVLRHPK